VALLNAGMHPGKRCFAGCRHRAIGILLAGLCVAADHFIGVRGIDVVNDANAVVPFAADQVAVQVHRRAVLQEPYRAACMSL